MNFETNINLKPQFAIIGYGDGDTSTICLHPIENGTLKQEIPFSKEQAQSIFKLLQSDEKQDLSFSGFIPNNVIYAHSNANNERLVFCDVAPKVKLHFEGTCKDKGLISKVYTLPSIIFDYKNGHLDLYAIKGKSFNPNSKLYHLTLPNIYNDGSLCLGNVKIEKPLDNSFETLMENIKYAFYNATFTHINASVYKYKTIKKNLQNTYTFIPFNKSISSLL